LEKDVMSNGGQSDPASGAASPDPAAFGVAVIDGGEQTRVALRGELDIWTSPRLQDTLDGLVAKGRRDLVLDLRDLDFIDSTGLGTLVAALKRLRGEGGTLTLYSPSPSTYRVFEITGLTSLFTIEGGSGPGGGSR
jgi:anti-sigma B factor antagonist